jgi:hypothetical protein
LPPRGGTCGLGALLAALEFARNSRGRSPAILYVSHGGGTCGGPDEAAYLERLLDVVTAANAGLARIHTFGAIGIGALGQRFLERLALRNGGTYR